MTTTHYILIGAVAGIIIGYYASDTLNDYTPWKNLYAYGMKSGGFITS
jgi:uncharacterized membrane-anchored protein YhcB (DUF1043 family)